MRWLISPSVSPRSNIAAGPGTPISTMTCTTAAVGRGATITNLQTTSPGTTGLAARIIRIMYHVPFMWQQVDTGILPALYAATSPDAAGGGFYGPSGFGELRGEAAVAKMPEQALDTAVSSRLWDVSERLTRVAPPAHR
jgi:hypothetical protein